MDINGIISYVEADGFEMVEEFNGDGEILERVIADLRADGCIRITVTFYDDED